jgi:hypothetical protein
MGGLRGERGPPGIIRRRKRATGAAQNGLVGLGPVDGQLEFVLGLVEVFFGLCSVAFHVIVVGRAGAFHFVDGFENVLVNFIEIVPIADSLGKHRARDKRKT